MMPCIKNRDSFKFASTSFGQHKNYDRPRNAQSNELIVVITVSAVVVVVVVAAAAAAAL